MLAEVDRIVRGLTDKESGGNDPWAGGTQQSNRLRAIAALCVQRYKGDLIEIGCYTGCTTRELAASGLLLLHNKKVLAVDPWADDPEIYAHFLLNTEEYRDVIDVIHLPSQDERAIEQIKARSLCFAFIDGLHTYNGLLSDILTVAHCQGVIAVDDVGYRCKPEDLRPALWDGARQTGRVVYWHPKCREAYLI